MNISYYLQACVYDYMILHVTIATALSEGFYQFHTLSRLSKFWRRKVLDH